jgi:hypothetical protein
MSQNFFFFHSQQSVATIIEASSLKFGEQPKKFKEVNNFSPYSEDFHYLFTHLFSWPMPAYRGYSAQKKFKEMRYSSNILFNAITGYVARKRLEELRKKIEKEVEEAVCCLQEGKEQQLQLNKLIKLNKLHPTIHI